MAKVAVLIATYKMSRHVDAAAKSVLDQSISDLELVIVDDGSTSDPRLHLVRQENKCQASAKNRGIAESTAPIVGFCDADDLWDIRKLQLFERPDVGVVYSREQRFMETPEGRQDLPYAAEQCHSGRVTNALFIESFVSHLVPRWSGDSGWPRWARSTRAAGWVSIGIFG